MGKYNRPSYFMQASFYKIPIDSDNTHVKNYFPIYRAIIWNIEPMIETEVYHKVISGVGPNDKPKPYWQNKNQLTWSKTINWYDLGLLEWQSIN